MTFAPPPPGDGCADAQKQVDGILNLPKARSADPAGSNAPKPKPHREYVLADLPEQCVSVLQSD